MSETLKAQDIPVPHEVIVHSRGGGIMKMYRVEILSHKPDNQRPEWQFNAIGRDQATGKRISLAPTTIVELARPIVNIGLDKV